MSDIPKKILIVRNDKLGDFILSLPSFVLLKTALPEAEIHALVSDYTRPIAEISPFIDWIITDPGEQAGRTGFLALLRTIKDNDYDAVITLYSTGRIGIIMLLAGIPYRLAPATKLAQLLYNHRLTQRRSRSNKPEFEYNLDLVRHFLVTRVNVPSPAISGPLLHFSDNEINDLRQDFCQQHGLRSENKLIFIHPGSGGSARNLSIDQYAELIQALALYGDFNYVISSGPGEYEYASQLLSLVEGLPAIIYNSTAGLVEYAKHLQFCDVFIGGSTGPLHLAGALDRPTAGFYPRRRSATSLRWQTLNQPARRLAFSPELSSAEEDMSSIDISFAAELIARTFLKH